MKKILSFICVLTLLLSGCTNKYEQKKSSVGTSEINTPSSSAAHSRDEASNEPSSSDKTHTNYTPAPDLTLLEADIKELSQMPRPIGSTGEELAANYISGNLQLMGYEVTLQKYTSETGSTGNNVIAVKKGLENSDILIISSHHDSFPTSFGANDNASGVAAMLAVAEKLRNIETDTELRFISFTDEENGKNGSRYYVDKLPQDQRDRIIGCIQFDMLGGLGADSTRVCTTDGNPNWLSELLTEKDSSLTLGVETASDHAVLQMAKIPAVLITQNNQGYLYHSAGDTKASLDLEKIYNAAATVADVVSHIASSDTPSYSELAQSQADSYFYSHSRQSKIFFSAPLKDNEAYLGFSGELVDTWDIFGDGWTDTYKVYEYKMGWFGSDELMTTHYIYRNGYLESVEVLPSEKDFTPEQLCALITNTHGQPCDSDSYAWNWQDELYGKYISLKVTDAKPVISIYPYSVGISNTLESYTVVDGEAQIDDQGHLKVWQLLCKALPKEQRQKLGQFQLFTDGYSNILAYTAPMENPDGSTDNSRFSITVDYYDVYDENGNARDWSKVLNTLIHEFGHVLLENDTQIDLSSGGGIHDPENFIEGSFRKQYYDEFWKDPYSSYLGSYYDKPENYVSGYAGNAFHEDIADTFSVFVFSSKPTGSSVAQKKILFFWNDSQMVALRQTIRSGLGLD